MVPLITSPEDVIGEVIRGDIVLFELFGGTGFFFSNLFRIWTSQKDIKKIVILPRGSSEGVLLSRMSPESTELVQVGKDVKSEDPHLLLRKIREVPPGSMVIVVRPENIVPTSDRMPGPFSGFIVDLAELAREKNLVLIFVVDTRQLPERDLAVLENVSTHVIELREEVEGYNVKHVVRIKKNPSGVSKFFEVTASENGVYIVELPSRQ